MRALLIVILPPVFRRYSMASPKRRPDETDRALDDCQHFRTCQNLGTDRRACGYEANRSPHRFNGFALGGFGSANACYFSSCVKLLLADAELKQMKATERTRNTLSKAAAVAVLFVGFFFALRLQLGIDAKLVVRSRSGSPVAHEEVRGALSPDSDLKVRQ